MEPPTKDAPLLAIPALIHRGKAQTPLDCTITEITENHAQLAVSIPDFIPDTFTLTLVGNGKVQRHCVVLSRSASKIFVEIEKLR